MLNNIEKVLYLILFFIFFLIRKYYTVKYKNTQTIKSKLNAIDIILLTLTGIAMLVPLFYIFSDNLDFANYSKPFCVSIVGVIILILANICLWYSHHDLSSNWTPTLGIKKEHQLVEDGIYKYIRHPMYAAHIYWAIGQILLLPNWIAGFSLIIFITMHSLSRIKNEEDMMIEHFGEEYINYMKNTGNIFPKIKL